MNFHTSPLPDSEIDTALYLREFIGKVEADLRKMYAMDERVKISSDRHANAFAKPSSAIERDDLGSWKMLEHVDEASDQSGNHSITVSRGPMDGYILEFQCKRTPCPQLDISQKWSSSLSRCSLGIASITGILFALYLFGLHLWEGFTEAWRSPDRILTVPWFLWNSGEAVMIGIFAAFMAWLILLPIAYLIARAGWFFVNPKITVSEREDARNIVINACRNHVRCSQNIGAPSISTNGAG